MSTATAVKERPIIFSAPLILALMDGKKTQTRRIIKPQPVFPDGVAKAHTYNDEYLPGVLPAFTVDCGDNAQGIWAINKAVYSAKSAVGKEIPCPYGRPGDRLWVREVWAKHPDSPHYGPIYRATDPGWDENNAGIKWKSPMFMPRVSCRILLEITGIRVERVQAITDADALAEGVEKIRLESNSHVPCHRNYGPRGGSFAPWSARESFETLWDSIYHDKPEKHWDKNLWVWVLEFKRVEVSDAS